MLEVINVSKRFGRQVVINDLNANFSNFGVTVIVGVNGSGKTTFLNLMTNLLQVDTGTILLDGNLVDTEVYKSKIFYIPSDFYLPYFMTGWEYADFVLSKYKKSDYKLFNRIIKLFDLKESLDKTLEMYSFGMKKKIQLAVGVATNTEVLIADEIFSSLDFETVILVQEIFSWINKYKKIIIVSHDRQTIEIFSEDIRLMSHGKLANFSGNPGELIERVKQEEVLNEKLNEIQQYFKHSKVFFEQ